MIRRVMGTTRLLAPALMTVLAMFLCPAFSFADTTMQSVEETRRLGRIMYEKGLLPSGKPMTAVVRGDIKVRGTMLTCAQCHMRSGLGSFEGTVLTPPTNGNRLYAPIHSGQRVPGMGRGAFKYARPPYTDESLALVLRAGVDSAGRVISETMPRYPLNDSDMAVMISYLRKLSSETAPGVTAEEIRFATVIAGDVSKADRAALLDPLQTYIRDEWNANMRVMRKLQRDNELRPAVLDIWELKGPADTWGKQLEAYYQSRPVFAILGGISNKSWKPVHDFCEKNRIPAVFPVTNLPAISAGDLYTLYFSKGLYQEGEAAAKYLARVFDLPPDKQIVQVYRDSEAGLAISGGFAETWKKLGSAPVKNIILTAGEKADKNFWEKIAGSGQNTVLVVWLAPEDLTGIESVGTGKVRPSLVFFSTSMLSESLSSVPDPLRDIAFVTYPHRLPEEEKQSSQIVEQWMKARKVSTSNMAVTSKGYALTRMLAKTLANMRGELYRDYFLDMFDVMEDQTTAAATFPRLSFGPGQRYASKGCYIISLTKGPQPQIIRQSNWVIY